jgi:hypothetical protein
MTITQIRQHQRIRNNYTAEIAAKIKNLSDPVPLEVLEKLYENIPVEMQTLFPQSELVRLQLNTDRRDSVRLALEETKYRAETILVHQRPYPIRIFYHRYSAQQVILNWIRSYRVLLPNKRPMTLDIFFGAQDIIPPKGRYISEEGLQSGERVLNSSHRLQSEQNLLRLKAIGHSGYYAIANRNFFEDRSLPSGTHFQRFILGPNTRQSLLRAACYLAKLGDYNDWRVTTNIYRSLLQKWLFSLRNCPHTRAFQNSGLSDHSINELKLNPTLELDKNSAYHKLIRQQAHWSEQQRTLEHLNGAFFVGDAQHGMQIAVTPNLLEPFHIYKQAVSLQSVDSHTQIQHRNNIKEAIKTVISTR